MAKILVKKEKHPSIIRGKGEAGENGIVTEEQRPLETLLAALSTCQSCMKARGQHSHLPPYLPFPSVEPTTNEE